MAIVWIIERGNVPRDSLATKLMGDFAVRVFASMESFQRLARISRKMLPDVVIVDGKDLEWSLPRIKNTFDYYLPDSLRVLVSDDIGLRRDADDFRVLSSTLEGMMLSSYLSRYLYESAPSRSILRFRDVIFDAVKSELRTVCGDSSHRLSRKEGCILQLLLEKPGACISREDIQNKVWDGVKVAPRNIDSHISRLRKRLVDTEVGIRSVYGGGYTLQ